MITLSKNQVNQLYQIMTEYDSATLVDLWSNSTTGVGVNLYATMKTADGVEHTIDITEYENW